MNVIAERLINKLQELGCKAKIVSVSHINKLCESVNLLIEDHTLEENFSRDNLSWLKLVHERMLPGAKSIIVAALPQCITKADFHYRGQAHKVTIPPIYVAKDSFRNAKNVIDAELLKEGHKAAFALLPLKLLAVRSGLGRYGRNNLCLVDGMGSFHALAAFYTDLDLEVDNWGEEEIDERCSNCTICIDSCPTGALSHERFVLKGEKCITYFNEFEYAFPEWVDPNWHNALIGCMHCQARCPQNQAFIGTIKNSKSFDEVETGLILEGASLDSLSETTRQKLDAIDMIPSYKLLRRNLRVLLEQKLL